MRERNRICKIVEHTPRESEKFSGNLSLSATAQTTCPDDELHAT
jgi:hypothetical protein